MLRGMEEMPRKARSDVQSKESRSDDEVRVHAHQRRVEPRCVGLPELFYGPFGNGPGGAFSKKKGTRFKKTARYETQREREEREAKCKEICAACPLQKACAEFALVEEEEWGIWGGWTEGERREFRAWCRKWGFDLVPYFPDLQMWIDAFRRDHDGARPVVASDRARRGPSRTNNVRVSSTGSARTNGSARKAKATKKRAS